MTQEEIHMARPIKRAKYDWREIWMHNTFKFFGIKTNIISEELHEKSKEN